MKRSILQLLETAPTRYSDNFYFFKNDLFIGQSIRMYGEYTQPEVDLLDLLVTPESVVYDIGANIGYHTVALANKCQEVHSFEANSDTFEVLEKNCASLDNVFLYNCALSNNNGTTKVDCLDLSSPGNFGEVHVSSKNESTQEVLCFCLDSLNLPPPAVIKIDVEGHELAVLEGAWITICKYRPAVFYENMHNPDFPKIYEKFASIGYKQYWFAVHNYNPNNFRNNQNNVFANSGVINVLAVPSNMVVNGLDEVIPGETAQQYVDRRFKVKQT